MARATSEKVGRGPCPDCGETVLFRRSSGGMLCHKCDNCDSSGYAAPGGDAYEKRMKSIASTYPKEPADRAPQTQIVLHPKEDTRSLPTIDKPRVIASVFSLADL